jgi:hypothetical protein
MILNVVKGFLGRAFNFLNSRDKGAQPKSRWSSPLKPGMRGMGSPHTHSFIPLNSLQDPVFVSRG